MRNAFTIAIIISLALPIACVKDGSRAGEQVIERSKRQPPNWVALDPNFIHQNDRSYSFVSFKSQILDLPLGVKQTQLGALTASQQALHATVRKELNDIADKGGVKIVSDKELDDRIMTSVKKFHGDFAQVADIYFEKIAASDRAAKEPQSFYRVYVLIEFASDKMASLLGDLSANLKASKKKDLSSLSTLINNRPR